MGTFIVNSAAAVALPASIVVDNIIETSNKGEKIVTVIVPSGTTKYIEIVATGFGASPNLTQTITSNAIYTLTVDANAVGIPPFPNTSTITLTVKQNNTFGITDAVEVYTRDTNMYV